MPAFRFHHAAISVPSLEEAIDWYGRILGYGVEKRFDITAANARAAMMRKDDMRLEIFEVNGAAPLPEDRLFPVRDLKTHGNKHAAYRVADFEQALSDMQAQGVDVAFVVREAFGKGFFIRDCAGNLIEFVEETAD